MDLHINSRYDKNKKVISEGLSRHLLVFVSVYDLELITDIYHGVSL